MNYNNYTLYGLGDPRIGPLPWTIDQPEPWTLNRVATALAVAGGILGLVLSIRALRSKRKRRR